MENEALLESLLRTPDVVQRRDLLLAAPRETRWTLIAALKERADAIKRVDPHRALSLGEIAGEVAASLNEDLARAQALWIQASAYYLMGEHKTATARHEEAIALFRSTGNLLEAAKVAVGAIGSLASLGRYEEAHSLARWADSVLEKHGDDVSRAKIALNLGIICGQRGEYARSLEHYRHARQMFDACGERLYEAMTKVNEANTLSWLGDFRQAERLYLEARAVFEEAGWRATLVIVDYDLADMRHGCGEYSQALQICERLRSLLQDPGFEVDIAYLDRLESAIYLDLNLADKALQHAQAAMLAFDRAGMSFEKGWALIHCGVASFRLGQRNQALSFLNQARELFDLQHNEVWVAHADSQIVEMLLQPGQLTHARALLRDVIAVYQRQGLVLNYAYGQLLMARLCLENGQPKQALAILAEIEQALGEIKPPWLIQRIQTLCGQAYESLGKSAHAYEAYRRATEVVERMAVTLPVEEHRMAFISDKMAPYEGLVFLLLSQKNAVEAFSWVERAKSRALLEHLTAEVRPRSFIQDAADRQRFERLHALRQELNWLYTRLLGGNGPRGEIRSFDPEVIWKEIQTREHEIAELWRALDTRYTEPLSLQRVIPLSPPQVQSALPEDTALLEYFLARERILAFLVTRNDIRAYALETSLEHIRPILEEWTFHLSKFYYGIDYYRRHQRALLAFAQDRLARLYDLLFAPLEEYLATFENLIIIPHGVLHSLPFHALYDRCQYLIEKKVISYAPSAAVLQFCWEKDIPLVGEAALFVGVPQAGLEFIEREVETLQACWPRATALLGEEATLEHLRRLSPQYGLIHLAAHGLFRPDAPLLSGIQLMDGWLAARDVYGMELRAGLVTLSACESGRGRISGGDEALGLARSFLYAGAASLLVNLWMVHDEAMMFLMANFYRALADGMPRAHALQAAQREAIARYPHPYFWAPLILMGSDGRCSMVSEATGSANRTIVS